MLTIELGMFILRLLIGLLFIGRGAQKLFGWFGGRGLKGTGEWMESLNLSPGRFWALVAGLAELLGGLGLALGFITPVAAALIIGVLLMAILKVHLVHGLWASENGLEYPLVNVFLAAFLGLWGASQYSVDAMLKLAYPSPMTFWIALAVVVAAVVVIALFSARGASERKTQSA